MQLASLFAAAGLAASTNAFLLPLAEPSESDAVVTLPVPVREPGTVYPETAEAMKLKLNCPGCPVPVGRHNFVGEAKFNTDIPSHLDLDIRIKHEADHDRLVVNDFELYPSSRPINNPLTASLVPDFKDANRMSGKKEGHMPGHIKGRPAAPQLLGFGLKSATIGKSKDDNFELVQIDLQILEVGDIFVDGIPNVQIKLIKSPEGALLVGGVEVTASESVMKNPMDKQEDCTTAYCKWRAMLMEQLGRFRGKHCGGGRPAHSTGIADGMGMHQRPHHSNPNSDRPHRSHHRWSRLLRNIASHILLPIAVGIAAGIFASVLGMAIGTGIVFLWRTFVRPAGTHRHRHHHRRQRGHSIHKAAAKESALVDEKAGLMAHQEEEVEAPPAYVEEGLVDNTKKADENQS